MSLLETFQACANDPLTKPWPTSRFTTVETGVCIVNGKLEALIGIILWDIGAKVRWPTETSRPQGLIHIKGLPFIIVLEASLE